MITPNDNSSEGQGNMKCPLCKGTLLGNLGGEFLACAGCGLWVRRSVGGMDDLYRSGWQSPLENLDLTGGTTPALGRNYVSELVIALGLKDLAGKRILDFGGGRGEMALALEAAGAKVVTVDPYSHAQLREKGLNAVESLAQLEKMDAFDGAIAIDVIEHLTPPWEQLRTIRSLLKAGGWFYLSTPNAAGLNARMNRADWREAHNPSHLYLFTPASMQNVLEKAGFARQRRLRLRVDYSDSWLIQAKDWMLRLVWLDGVLRYLAYV